MTHPPAIKPSGPVAIYHRAGLRTTLQVILLETLAAHGPDTEVRLASIADAMHEYRATMSACLLSLARLGLVAQWGKGIVSISRTGAALVALAHERNPNQTTTP